MNIEWFLNWSQSQNTTFQNHDVCDVCKSVSMSYKSQSQSQIWQVCDLCMVPGADDSILAMVMTLGNDCYDFWFIIHEVSIDNIGWMQYMKNQFNIYLFMNWKNFMNYVVLFMNCIVYLVTCQIDQMDTPGLKLGSLQNPTLCCYKLYQCSVVSVDSFERTASTEMTLSLPISHESWD